MYGNLGVVLPLNCITLYGQVFLLFCPQVPVNVTYSTCLSVTVTRPEVVDLAVTRSAVYTKLDFISC